MKDDNVEKGSDDMSIFYVRHGQTDWNVMGRLQGRSDIPLNNTGRQQALLTRKVLMDETIDLIYCSPLQRAKETASIINDLWGLEIREDSRLMERCFGVWEGNSMHDIDNSIWYYNDHEPFKGAESMLVFFARVFEFLDALQKEAIDKNILIVAHGGVCIPFQCYYDGIRKDDMSDLIPHNCQVIKKEGKRISV